jgi:tetratricopeptide (TPR) repeat protein
MEVELLRQNTVARFAADPAKGGIALYLRDAGDLPAPQAAAACARILQDAGLLKDAERIFAALAAAYPTVPAGPVGLAQIAMQRAAWAEALERWDRALTSFRDKPNPAWRSARATVLAELGRSEEARAALDRLARDFYEAPAGFVGLAQFAMRERLWSEAVERWNEILARFDDRAARPRWETARAWALLELGQTAAAETALRPNIMTHPVLFRPLECLLNLLMRTGRQRQALEMLEASALGNLDVPALLAIRCRILIGLRRLPDARTTFTRALDAADDVNSIASLVVLVPQLYEGWARTEGWLALRAKLDLLPYPGGRADVALIRARLLLALRDYNEFLAAADQAEASRLARQPNTLAAIARTLRGPDYRDCRNQKVFGIGLSKTGTTTLAAALTALGLVTLDWWNPLTFELMSDDDLNYFSAFTDTKACLEFEKYYYMFQNSKFVYTTRAIDTWVASVQRHWERQFGLYGFEAVREALVLDTLPHGSAFRNLVKTLYFNHADWPEAYRTHDRRVRQFFADKPKGRFLEFDVFRGDGWPELCEFLGNEVPALRFPWENRAKSAEEGSAHGY